MFNLEHVPTYEEFWSDFQKLTPANRHVFLNRLRLQAAQEGLRGVELLAQFLALGNCILNRAGAVQFIQGEEAP